MGVIMKKFFARSVVLFSVLTQPILPAMAGKAGRFLRAFALLFLVASSGCNYATKPFTIDMSHKGGANPISTEKAGSEDEISAKDNAQTPTETILPANPSQPATEPEPLPAPSPVSSGTKSPSAPSATQPPSTPSAPVADTAAPTIISVTPNGDGNTPTKTIGITFSEAMDAASVTKPGALLVIPSSGYGCDNGGKWEKTELSDNGTKATIFFTKPLEGCSFIAQVSGQVTDKAGNALGQNYVWNFQVKDATPPLVIGTDPFLGGDANTDKVTLTFSEPMNPDSSKIILLIVPVDYDDFSACYNGTAWKSNTWNADRTKVTVAYTKPLGPCKFKAVVAGSLTDVAGNNLESYQWIFDIAKDPLTSAVSLREYYRIDGSGGAGGAPSEGLCEDGEVLVGLSLVEDGVIASVIGYACQNIHTLNVRDQRWVTVNPIRQPGTIRKDYVAALGEALVGFSTKTVEKNDSLVVGEFVASYAKITEKGLDTASIRQDSMVSGNGGSDTWSNELCPKGFAQVGLRMRAGAYMDRLGAVCRRVAPAGEERTKTEEMATITRNEGYEFGFVEYDWTPDSIGMGENSQPCLGGDGVQVLECSPGYGIVSIGLHANEIVDKIYGFTCQGFGDTGSGDPEYFLAEQQQASDPGIHFINAAKGSFFTGWNHKRSENDADGNQDDVMVSEMIMIQQAFAKDGSAGVPGNVEGSVGQGIHWDGANDNYTDWIAETCPVGFVLSGIKMKMENNRPRALGGICRRVVAPGQEAGFGSANPRP